MRAVCSFVVLAALVSACGSSSPSAPSPQPVHAASIGGTLSAQTADVLAGRWCGSTVSDGDPIGSGQACVTFLVQPAGDGELARVEWTPKDRPTVHYEGGVYGDLTALTVKPFNAPVCSYTAQGSIADGVFTARYQAAGDCPEDTGTARLVKQVAP